MNRRTFVRTAGVAISGAFLAGCNTKPDSSTTDVSTDGGPNVRTTRHPTTSETARGSAETSAGSTTEPSGTSKTTVDRSPPDGSGGSGGGGSTSPTPGRSITDEIRSTTAEETSVAESTETPPDTSTE